MLAATGVLPEEPSGLSSAQELALASSGDLPIANAASIDDTFNDGVFNADGQWDPHNITQGGQSPAHILYDEATSPGAFRVTYYTAGIPQTTMLLRKDASMQVVEYAQDDLTFAAGPNFAARGNTGTVLARLQYRWRANLVEARFDGLLSRQCLEQAIWRALEWLELVCRKPSTRKSNQSCLQCQPRWLAVRSDVCHSRRADYPDLACSIQDRFVFGVRVSCCLLR